MLSESAPRRLAWTGHAERVRAADESKHPYLFESVLTSFV